MKDSELKRLQEQSINLLELVEDVSDQFCDDNIPPTSASLKDIYDEHKDDDGFLYMTYAGENTFG